MAGRKTSDTFVGEPACYKEKIKGGETSKYIMIALRLSNLARKKTDRIALNCREKYKNSAFFQTYKIRVTFSYAAGSEMFMYGDRSAFKVKLDLIILLIYIRFYSCPRRFYRSNRPGGKMPTAMSIMRSTERFKTKGQTFLHGLKDNTTETSEERCTINEYCSEARADTWRYLQFPESFSFHTERID